MKKTLFFVLLVFLTVVMVSCNLFGNGEEQGNSSSTKKLVKVSFCPQSTKSLSSAYADGLKTNYYLKAVPDFTRETNVIVGKVDNQLITPDSSGNFDAGYFEQGKWDFTVDAYVENTDGSIKTKVATQTISGFYISEQNNVVSFNLSDVSLSGSGSVTVSIKVPKISDSTAKLVVKVDGTEVAFKTTPTQTAITGTDLIQFDGLLENVSSGNRKINLYYYVEKNGETDPSKKNILISSDVIAIRMIDDANIRISGNMMNEKNASGLFNVVISSEVWKASVTPSNSSVSMNTEKTFSCSVTGTTSSVTYQWYVDGTPISGATAASYKFKSSACGVFSITCLTTVNGFAKTASTYVSVIEQ